VTAHAELHRIAGRCMRGERVGYEACLRGRSHLIKLTRSDLDAALDYFELALQKDPSYGLAYAGIAGVWSGRQQMNFSSWRRSFS